jgi:hypothetical protein
LTVLAFLVEAVPLLAFDFGITSLPSKISPWQAAFGDNPLDIWPTEKNNFTGMSMKFY